MKRIENALKMIYRKSKIWIIRHKKVKKKKIVFSQFGGMGYGCNPKAICNEFLRRDEGYDLVWLLGNNISDETAGIPEGVRIARGYHQYYELFSARVWINNVHFNKLIEGGLYKRRGTLYLNTFHGGITLKNEGKDKHSYKANRKLSIKEQMFRKDADFVDYITSGCSKEDHVLEEFFYGKGKILRLGDARTDILINGSQDIQDTVRKHYNIPEGTKVVVYAPTFRTDLSLKWYDLNYEQILDTLEEKYGCPWKMLIRLHPRIREKSSELVPKTDRFIDASDYRDMQDIAIAADMMISDYSSVITDFMLTRKPAFMYVPDLEKYISSRGMYYEMEELPFAYATTTGDLITILQNHQQEDYQKRVEQFLQHIDYLADGQAAKRIVDFIIEKM